MYRSKTCGELRLADAGQQVTLGRAGLFGCQFSGLPLDTKCLFPAAWPAEPTEGSLASILHP